MNRIFQKQHHHQKHNEHTGNQQQTTSSIDTINYTSEISKNTKVKNDNHDSNIVMNDDDDDHDRNNNNNSNNHATASRDSSMDNNNNNNNDTDLHDADVVIVASTTNFHHDNHTGRNNDNTNNKCHHLVMIQRILSALFGFNNDIATTTKKYDHPSLSIVSNKNSSHLLFVCLRVGRGYFLFSIILISYMIPPIIRNMNTETLTTGILICMTMSLVCYDTIQFLHYCVLKLGTILHNNDDGNNIIQFFHQIKTILQTNIQSIQSMAYQTSLDSMIIYVFDPINGFFATIIQMIIIVPLTITCTIPFCTKEERATLFQSMMIHSFHHHPTKPNTNDDTHNNQQQQIGIRIPPDSINDDYYYEVFTKPGRWMELLPDCIQKNVLLYHKDATNGHLLPNGTNSTNEIGYEEIVGSSLETTTSSSSSSALSSSSSSSSSGSFIDTLSPVSMLPDGEEEEPQQQQLQQQHEQQQQEVVIREQETSKHIQNNNTNTNNRNDNHHHQKVVNASCRHLVPSGNDDHPSYENNHHPVVPKRNLRVPTYSIRQPKVQPPKSYRTKIDEYSSTLENTTTKFHDAPKHIILPPDELMYKFMSNIIQTKRNEFICNVLFKRNTMDDSKKRKNHDRGIQSRAISGACFTLVLLVGQLRTSKMARQNILSFLHGLGTMMTIGTFSVSVATILLGIQYKDDQPTDKTVSVSQDFVKEDQVYVTTNKNDEDGDATSTKQLSNKKTISGNGPSPIVSSKVELSNQDTGTTSSISVENRIQSIRTFIQQQLSSFLLLLQQQKQNIECTDRQEGVRNHTTNMNRSSSRRSSNIIMKLKGLYSWKGMMATIVLFYFGYKHRQQRNNTLLKQYKLILQIIKERQRRM